MNEELETMTGWLSLLTSPQNLPSTWGLPKVAGVLSEEQMAKYQAMKEAQG